MQLSFGSFVYPSLILAYLGQGSCLIVNGADVLPNVFYLTIPGRHNGPLFWILYVFAILATLIASQAMITATFSLVQQLVNMRCFPPYGSSLCTVSSFTYSCRFRVHMVHTSDKVQGQIFIPVANWTREHPLPSAQPTLNAGSSHDSDRCYCRRLQQRNSADQCVRFCCGDSHVYYNRAHLASNSICQTPSLHFRDFVFAFLRILGW
jgi:hypothetical protein